MEKRKIKKIKHGILQINSNLNNTIATIRDSYGNILCWSSAGEAPNDDTSEKKLKGKSKKSEHAAFLAIKSVCNKCLKFGLRYLYINFKDYGPALSIVAQTVIEMGLRILSLTDITPIAFNGCRPRKKKRKKRDIRGKEIKYVKVRHQKEFD